MAMFLGLNDASQGFDHFFLMCENWMKFVPQVLEAISQGVIKTSIEIDETAINRLQQIWEGHIWLLVRRHPRHPEKVVDRIITFSKPKEQYPNEVIQLPALQNLSPVSHIKDATMCIRIREPVPVKYAFAGEDVAQLVLQGGFYYNFIDGRKPMFQSSSDIQNSRALTMVVSRNYFHSVINIEKKIFLKYFNVVYINFHRILREEKLGFDDDDRVRHSLNPLERIEQ